MIHGFVLKVTRTLLLFAIAALMFPATAAGARPETIKFTKTQLTVREALAEIKTQTGYGTAFNGRQFDANRTVTLASARLTLDEAMEQMLDGSGFSYIRNGRIISIIKSEPEFGNEAATTQGGINDDNRRNSKPDRNEALQRSRFAERIASPESVPNQAVVLSHYGLGTDYEPATRHSAVNRKTVHTVSMKTNLLYDLAAVPNLAVEFRLGGRTSLDVPTSWNPFTLADNRKWKHVLIQPELRFWARETFAGHFFGLHGHYAYYNTGGLPKPFSQYMRDHRFEGWLAGAGVSYGYRWNFGKDKAASRWGMEATVGVGYAYMEYGKYPCARCGEKIADESKHYLGPTKVGLSLIYNIGRKRQAVAATLPAPSAVYNTLVIVDMEQETAPAPVPSAVAEPYTPRYVVSYIIPEVEAVKLRSDEGKAYLDFAVGKAEIVSGFKNNAAELHNIHTLIESVKNDPDATITGITIKGYASPEGTYATNFSLSERRAQSLRNHIRTLYGFPDSIFTVEGKGEDWATLEELVARSRMNDKYAILEIIRGTDIFDGREKKLMLLSGGEPYRRMKAEMFPQLRRTEYRLHYTVLPFTVEKGREVFKSKPSSLSLNEMFMLANTCEPGSDEFNEILETAARMFPQNDTANLNAAASALARKDTVSAQAYLSKVTERTAAYHNNMGVLYGLREEWDNAAEAFRRALSAGEAEIKANAAETTRAIESRRPANGDN